MRPGAPGYGERKNPDSTCASDLACAAVRLPSGGRFSLVLEPGGNGPPPLIEQAWVAGFEAPAREARLRDRGPTRFGRLLPPPHPLGFGAALELDIDEP